MSKNFTEKELQIILKKNKDIKISSTTNNNQIKKATLENTESKKKKKTVKLNLDILEANKSEDIKVESVVKKKLPSSVVAQVNEHNLNSTYSYTYSDEHVSILFHNAKLLTVNQLFALLENSKFNVFRYKAICHSMVKKVLEEMYLDAKVKGIKLPFFKENAELILYRRGVKLVDEDSLSTMFKYVLDALKYNDKVDSRDYNPLGILEDDNPKIIHRITNYTEKGVPSFGLQVKICKNLKKDFNAEDILKIED